MKTKRPLTAEAALVRAEELCARAEHCSGEIREKLYKWGVGEAEREKIIVKLIERRFVYDERFARIFARDKVEFSGWGKRKIALALYQKRVDRQTINDALAEIDETRYQQRLREVIATKRRSITDADTYEGRTRLYRYAASRGFEPELIAKILRENI